jgi:hypothetical protein
MCHNSTWPPVTFKITLEIKKFKGKSGKDPNDHVTTFDLWCSSNSLNDDSVCLRLFQCTLMGVVTKWYMELLRGTYQTFHELALFFLNHFQLSGQYDIGTKILLTFHQDKSTHTSDHIQECCGRKWFIKDNITP